MTDELDIVRPRAPIKLPYTVPGFWEGARQARLQIADAEAHPRDAADHRRVADEYQTIAGALAEGRVLEDLPEYVQWIGRSVMFGKTA